ncbi:methylated-DNA--[protein]-cysteine S-methyltransferase [Desmospora profundinema]|uniref:Methylated-DNA-[protein]-cysteine S-methyltransferase n=1 Tax=Desmospora profundinema TaxID=1571184 RepID=A0ABU1IH41_9BACL|nr:methylated-DNA--[protein]-cysteine S-methyltransferase [Desmospora profundinema]MDR6224101.1 methylated-DNA-[protein]-cysteine S-methyltransferase [Desmospora profundinema]
METIHWFHFSHGEQSFHLAATPRGLCHLSLPGEPYHTLELWVNRHTDGASLVEDKKALHPYWMQLEEYLNGSRTAFTFSVDLKGTPFQRAVWRELLTIPHGATRSYSDVAAAIGRPRAVRAVGAANRQNPVPIVIPCHRVVGKDGRLVGYRGGMALKKQLLLLESG